MQAAATLKDRVQELKPYMKTVTARNIITFLSQRNRQRRITDIKHLKYDILDAGYMIDENDYVDFWEGLQKTGIGQIVYGTEQQKPVLDKDGAQLIKDGVPQTRTAMLPDRFHWNYSCKALGEVCLQEINRAPETKTRPVAVIRPAAPKAAHEPDPARAEVKQTLRLKSGKAAVFIPANASKEDLEKLLASIQSMVAAK